MEKSQANIVEYFHHSLSHYIQVAILKGETCHSKEGWSILYHCLVKIDFFPRLIHPDKLKYI